MKYFHERLCETSFKEIVDSGLINLHDLEFTNLPLKVDRVYDM